MTETHQQHRPDANDVLMGGGGFPTLKLDQFRVWVGGALVAKPTARQETEYGTGKPKTFPKSGDPIYGLLVDVQTDQRTDAEDDGIRRLYVEGKRLKDAVRDAVIASGATGLEARGQLFVAWVGEEQGQGATPAKVYEARYYPPTTPVPGTSNGSAGAPAPMADPRAADTAAYIQGSGPSAVPVVPPGMREATPEEMAAAQRSQGGTTAPAPVQAAPMPEPGAQSPAQSPAPTPAAAPVAAPTAPVANEPTAEAIAALKAAGLDPRAVFPNYQA
jgi:hypothetical protein